MGTKKNVKEYIPEAIKNLGEYLEKVRLEGSKKLEKTRVNLEGLKKAIWALPKEDRENIEKFWGLTGGPNHSKKIAHLNIKDVAYIQMRNKALQSFSKLDKLDLASMYDESVQTLTNLVIKKVNKNGLPDISDMECVKYLIAFFILVENGPKMSFEKDLMQVDTRVDKMCYVDEYEALNELAKELKEFPDNSINLGLVKSVLESLDFKDCVVIQKSFGMESTDTFRSDEIQILDTFSRIRAFKEKVFGYGAWEVTCGLVLGYDVNLKEFWKAIDILRKDWSKMDDFKTSQKNLQTVSETRTLNVYSIGGLEFTDPYEVMVLYLERNLIAS